MTFLADLIGGGDISDDAASAAAKMNLNLFGDDGSDAGGGGGDAQSQVRLYARRAQACVLFIGYSPTQPSRLRGSGQTWNAWRACCVLDDHDRRREERFQPCRGIDGRAFLWRWRRRRRWWRRGRPPGFTGRRGVMYPEPIPTQSIAPKSAPGQGTEHISTISTFFLAHYSLLACSAPALSIKPRRHRALVGTRTVRTTKEAAAMAALDILPHGNSFNPHKSEQSSLHATRTARRPAPAHAVGQIVSRR